MADTMTKKEMDKYYKEEGVYHESDPRHPMNKELTGPSVMIMLGVKPPKKKPAEPKKKKKTEMAYGGMASGKKHMYVAGGMVTDNPGLKALKASGPKGMEAYNKITKNR
tara:strand:- start:39 stop:365 length:327 start_codon:yes stop_codon:yes gene_type:complete